MDGVNLAFEFAKSRGVIHFHAPLAMAHSKMDEVGVELQKFGIITHDQMTILDEWINLHFDDTPMTNLIRKQLKYTNSTGDFTKVGLELRKLFCGVTPQGKAVLETYENAMEVGLTICSESVGNIMEINFGLDAMHCGEMPEQWVKPGLVTEEHGY